MAVISAAAQPEKRLFISLITRDISLIDALLDIVDNSINAALEPMASKLVTADDYQKLLAKKGQKPTVTVALTVSAARIEVSDNASGISSIAAKSDIFKFGKDESGPASSDRLSVYGIGLKRAMFKCGNKISMISDHKKGGFSLDLDVKTWATEKKEPWVFAISERAPTSSTGTRISISELYSDMRKRIEDGLFLEQLRERLSRTYSFFIGRIVDIQLNGKVVEREPFDIGGNYASEKFITNQVSCNITAGIAAGSGDRFRDRNAGWYVFCNGRAVLFADKTTLTGWGGAGLPIFQPKHRPFLGTVFFVSKDPELLPWTTTKGTINEENAAWQEAKRHMVTTGRVITGFLDKRYTEEGTDVAPADLREASGESVSVLSAAVSKKRQFSPPKKKGPKEVRIQYSARVSDVQLIESHLKRPGMGGSEVGRYTFSYFLKNEVGSK